MPWRKLAVLWDPCDMPNAREQVGRRIRELRESAGRSQRWLAERAGVSPGHVAQIEKGTGNASLDVLVAIATSLGVGVADLVVRVRRRSSPDVVRRPRLPQHVEAVAYEIAALPANDRTRALRAIRALLSFGGRKRKPGKQ